MASVPPPALVDHEEGVERRAGDVHPVQTRRYPGARLVEVDQRGVAQQVRDHITEQAEPAAGFAHHLGDSAHGDRHAEHVAEQFGEALVGEVLVDGKVNRQCPDARAVARWSRRLGGRLSLGFAPTGAPAALHAVLGDMRPHRGELEDLAAFDVDDLCSGEVCAAARAHTGCVGDHLAGIVHLGEMLALGTGLLPRPALRRPTLGPVRRRAWRTPLETEPSMSFVACVRPAPLSRRAVPSTKRWPLRAHQYERRARLAAHAAMRSRRSAPQSRSRQNQRKSRRSEFPTIREFVAQVVDGRFGGPEQVRRTLPPSRRPSTSWTYSWTVSPRRTRLTLGYIGATTPQLPPRLQE